MVVGFVTAGVVGYLSIRWLLHYLTNHPLYYFSGYLFIAAALVWILK
jgi:undecaprenyl pyrophosphate phosphatase UppP